MVIPALETHHVVGGPAAVLGRMMVTRREHRQAVRQRHTAWLKALIEQTGIEPTPLGKRAGVETSLTRFLNDPHYKGALSPDTIERLKTFYGVPGPDEYAAGGALARGFGEAEQVNLESEPTDVAAVMRAILKGRKAADVWRLKTDTLVEAGYLPGDLVVVDLSLMPERRDAVCAQVFDLTHMRAETVWRIYDPPFLLPAARDRSIKPLMVENVAIKGVIVGSARPWRASAA